MRKSRGSVIEALRSGLYRRLLRELAVSAALIAHFCEAGAQQGFAPSAFFVQGGAASHTQSLTIGLAWDWNRQWELGAGALGGHFELSLTQWGYNNAAGSGKDRLTQLAIAPVFRWRLSEGMSPWFVEAGVGLSLTSTLYQTQDKRFSTRFNFGSHLGAGRRFGLHDEHELALRVEHFSNAGIRHPNPGENFVQLRYTYRFQ